LLEYVALGLPVIVARTPAIAAYFDETMVHFFEPGNVEDLAASILKLYQDRSRREVLVRHSERFHQQYNWANLSLEYATLIDRLNQRQRGRPDSPLSASNVLI
jgi:glycosyltransferase involved in cell wall biosynthesis